MGSNSLKSSVRYIVHMNIYQSIDQLADIFEKYYVLDFLSFEGIEISQLCGNEKEIISLWNNINHFPPLFFRLI